MDFSTELTLRSKRVKLLLMDCDGVLTDGRLFFSAAGEAMKIFDVKDGQGLALWHSAGFTSGIISGRDAEAIIRSRADEIGIRYVFTGSTDKVADFRAIIASESVEADEVAYVGDDIGDIAVMNLVGFPIAVGDAASATKSAAIYTTMANGGRGAIREVVELLLRSRSGEV